MGSFAAGVTIITARDAEGCHQAMTATAFTAVSLQPPLCLVCIDRRARAHGPLLLHGSFGVSILGLDQEAVAAQCAAPVQDRLAGVRWQPGSQTGCPLITGALAAMECQLVQVHAGGDHDILVGLVQSARVREGRPLLYWRSRYGALRTSSVEQAQQAVDSIAG
jgi:flavin reductase (DIM6/NTAB) family NADH-FMN oxidoreductase RutF